MLDRMMNTHRLALPDLARNAMRPAWTESPGPRTTRSGVSDRSWPGAVATPGGGESSLREVPGAYKRHLIPASQCRNWTSYFVRDRSREGIRFTWTTLMSEATPVARATTFGCSVPNVGIDSPFMKHARYRRST
jgi:hypothetical protein